MDGKITSSFRNAPYIDGSFLSKDHHYFGTKAEDDGEELPSDVIVVDWKRDPIMEKKSLEFVRLTSKDGIWDMIEQGKNYAKILEERGEFESLPKW